MSVFLRLIPFGRENDSLTFSHNFFNCDKDYYLFEQLKQISTFPVPPNFESFFDNENGYDYGVITKTPYDEALTYALVKDLLECKPHSEAQTNKAIWAYLKQLPPQTKVALYWH